MWGRVGRDPCLFAQHAFGFESADGFAVALVRVQAHHLHRGHLLAGLLFGPSPQLSGIASVEHVHDLPGVSVDRGGGEPAAPAARRGRHDGLVHADTGRRVEPCRGRRPSAA